MRRSRADEITSRFLASLICVAAMCAAFSNATASDVHSAIITTDTGPLVIHVPDLQFLRIHNFTQQDGSGVRGIVQVAKDGTSENVLTATTIDPHNPPPAEFIKDVVIAGPSTVTVNPVTNATLFITYKKHVEATPTPTPTATVIPITPTPTPTPTATP